MQYNKYIINGKGIIKEYDNENNLIFEGEYFYGLRNGKGKEYIAIRGKMKNIQILLADMCKKIYF